MTVVELKIIAPSAMVGCKSPDIAIGMANIIIIYCTKKPKKDLAV
jgi:hypothetical protein